jgi:Suppressor of fused protein (SUFU)
VAASLGQAPAWVGEQGAQEGDVDDHDAWQAAVRDAREDFYRTHFGPLPDEALKLEQLMAVWPAGCLVQVQADRLDGLTVSASFGLTDPGLPPSVQVGRSVRERTGWPPWRRREPTRMLAPRAPNPPADGLAGYGFELVVLTVGRDFWPLLLLNWAVTAEILEDADILRRVREHQGLTVQDIDLGEDGPADFLIEPVDSLFPAEHGLPNGAMHLLVATAITRSELTFGLEEGHQALLAKLFEDGPGQVSVLGRDPVV